MTRVNNEYQRRLTVLRAAVFIDGGYLAMTLKSLGEPRIDYSRLARWAVDGCDLFRTYYYDCLPYHGYRPSDEERRRAQSKQSFITALNRLDRFTIRLGRLALRGKDDHGAPIFDQKRVDLMLGLDIATIVSTGKVDLVALVAGDGDLIPAVRKAKEEGALVRLVHGPRLTYDQDLWHEADERRELNAGVFADMPLE
ncbi:MAG: NYN domain-containing protein [bacterium]